MTDKLQTGKEGEERAAAHLIGKGYQILSQNYRYKRAEVDIIAQKDNLLLFVEVKTRSSTEFGYPEDSVDEKKAQLIIGAAEKYINDIDWKGHIRFDVISIEQEKGIWQLRHFEDAFY